MATYSAEERRRTQKKGEERQIKKKNYEDIKKNDEDRKGLAMANTIQQDYHLKLLSANVL